MPFRSMYGFAEESRKIARNEGDFGGKLTHSLTHALTRESKSRYISTGITLPLDAWDDSEQQIDLQFLQDFEAYMTRKGNSSNSLEKVWRGHRDNQLKSRTFRP